MKMEFTIHTNAGRRFQVAQPYLSGEVIYFAEWKPELPASLVWFDCACNRLCMKGPSTRLTIEVKEGSARKLMEWKRSLDEEVRSFAGRLQQGIEQVRAVKCEHGWQIATVSEEAYQQQSGRFQKGFLHMLGKALETDDPIGHLRRFSAEGREWQGSFGELVERLR